MNKKYPILEITEGDKKRGVFFKRLCICLGICNTAFFALYDRSENKLANGIAMGVFTGVLVIQELCITSKSKLMQLTQFTFAILVLSPMLETDLSIEISSILRQLRGMIIIMFGLVTDQTIVMIIALHITLINEAYSIYL